MKMNRSILLASVLFISCTLAPIAHAETLDIWWPTDNSHLSGTQPFKAMVEGRDVSTYTMYWQVDNGQLNQMQTNTADYPHKEATVDLSGWNWQSSGAYKINFVAKDQSGNTIAARQETIYLPTSAPATNSTPAPTATQTSTPTQTAPQNPVTAQPTTAPTASTQPTTSTPAPVQTVNSSTQFYVSPNSDAASQAQSWASSRPSDAAKMQTLAAQPTASWFGNWNSNVQNDVSNVVKASSAAGKTAVLVAYNIPNRDCGGYSAGGTSDYASWIRSFAQGIGSGKAVVILEPDAVAQASCLSSSDQVTRFSLLSQAVQTLKANPNTSVYIDAGHSGWVDPNTMAANLKKAGIAQANGFSLNVSNFDTTSSESSYGAQISSALGGAHFVIDTSRNGKGSNGEWCNPSGRAIGAKPTTNTGNSLIDALLWIKTPGESDGNCNGGPNAGNWWADYALGLVNNA